MTRRSAPPSEEIEPVSATPPSAAEPRSRGARLMSLTLLDGTQIQLPSQKQAAPEAAALEELLATLRQGGAVSEVGPVLAALLELLVRKGLVSERELLEELAKR